MSDNGPSATIPFQELCAATTYCFPVEAAIITFRIEHIMLARLQGQKMEHALTLDIPDRGNV